jgi:hypothetical protein
MGKEDHSYQCSGKGPWIAARVGKGILIGVALALIFGIFVRLLWNWLMPAVFGLREISYLQAVGMIVLSRIFFGVKGRPGFPGRRGGKGPWAWSSPCSGEDLSNGHLRDWRHYDAWWEAEGREAFKKYIDNHGS